MSKYKNKKMLLIVPCFMLIVSSFFVWNSYLKSKDSSDNSPEETINLDPPTDQEIAETELHKQEVVKRTEQENEVDQNSSTKKTVTPTISRWGMSGSKLEVYGYIAGIYESNGTCTLTMEKSGKKINVTSKSAKDAQVTTCHALEIPKGQLSNGSWNIQLTYSSPNAQGASNPMAIEVQ